MVSIKYFLTLIAILFVIGFGTLAVEARKKGNTRPSQVNPNRRRGRDLPIPIAMAMAHNANIPLQG